MPGIDGIDTATELLSLTPGAGIVIVTSHGRPGYLKRALTAGVRGFLPKTVTAAPLADVIRTIAGGGRHVDPQLAAEAISTGDTVLTAREADVLEYAIDGGSTEEIAKRAYLSAGLTPGFDSYRL